MSVIIVNDRQISHLTDILTNMHDYTTYPTLLDLCHIKINMHEYTPSPIFHQHYGLQAHYSTTTLSNPTIAGEFYLVMKIEGHQHPI